jgi:hypothetical protein
MEETQESDSKRNRVKLVVEDAIGLYDSYDGKKPIPLPPRNVIYSDGFLDAWHTIVEKKEEDTLCDDNYLPVFQNMLTSFKAPATSVNTTTLATKTATIVNQTTIQKTAAPLLNGAGRSSNLNRFHNQSLYTSHPYFIKF